METTNSVFECSVTLSFPDCPGRTSVFEQRRTEKEWMLANPYAPDWARPVTHEEQLWFFLRHGAIATAVVVRRSIQPVYAKDGSTIVRDSEAVRHGYF